MIQDISPHHLNNAYLPGLEAAPEDSVLCFSDRKTLCSPVGELIFPRRSELSETLSCQYLFSMDGERYFLAGAPEKIPAAFQWTDLRAIREENRGPKHRRFALMTAKHLYDWYRDNRYCGRCGTLMQHSDTERALVCPSCDCHVYPRIMPAVIVGVTDGDRLLLTKYSTGFAHNALVAGFTEIGETVEETVAREVMEEVGLKVSHLRYYKSQPWGIANDLLLGFYCDADSTAEIRVDHSELSQARWCTRDEIILQPNEDSLTNEMMKRFKEGLPC